MDPVTNAIIAAITAGMARVSEQAVLDSYNALKELIKRKFGPDSEIAKAVENVEAKPESTGRKETLKEEVEAAKAHQDPEILEAAQIVLDKLKAQSIDAQIIQTATGNQIAQAGLGSTASVNVSKTES